MPTARVWNPGSIGRTKLDKPVETLDVKVFSRSLCGSLGRVTYLRDGVPVMEGYVSLRPNTRVYTSGRWWDYVKD